MGGGYESLGVSLLCGMLGNDGCTWEMEHNPHHLLYDHLVCTQDKSSGKHKVQTSSDQEVTPPYSSLADPAVVGQQIQSCPQQTEVRAGKMRNRPQDPRGFEWKCQ